MRNLHNLTSLALGFPTVALPKAEAGHHSTGRLVPPSLHWLLGRRRRTFGLCDRWLKTGLRTCRLIKSFHVGVHPVAASSHRLYGLPVMDNQLLARNRRCLSTRGFAYFGMADAAVTDDVKIV